MVCVCARAHEHVCGLDSIRWLTVSLIRMMVGMTVTNYTPSDVSAEKLAFRKYIPQLQDSNKVVNVTVDALCHTRVLQAEKSTHSLNISPFKGWLSTVTDCAKQDGGFSRNGDR